MSRKGRDEPATMQDVRSAGSAAFVCAILYGAVLAGIVVLLPLYLESLSPDKVWPDWPILSPFLPK